MIALDTSPEAVTAMAELLRVRQSDTCDKAADLLAALSAERDEAKRDAVNEGVLKERAIYESCQIRADLAAARATIAEWDAEIATERSMRDKASQDAADLFDVLTKLIRRIDSEATWLYPVEGLLAGERGLESLRATIAELQLRVDAAEGFCNAANKAAGGREFACAETVPLRATIAERDAEIVRQSADRASLWENWNKSTEAFRAIIAEAETRESNLRDASIRSGNEISELRATIARLTREKAEAPPTDAAGMREMAAKFAQQWLEDWGHDLAATRDSYRDATISGKHNGRTIAKELAKNAAHNFDERASAVHDCGALLAKDIRTLPLPPSPTADALRAAEWDEFRAWVAEMTKKHGKAVGTQYEEGQNDMGARVLLKLDALAAIRKTKEG